MHHWEFVSSGQAAKENKVVEWKCSR